MDTMIKSLSSRAENCKTYVKCKHGVSIAHYASTVNEDMRCGFDLRSGGVSILPRGNDSRLPYAAQRAGAVMIRAVFILGGNQSASWGQQLAVAAWFQDCGAACNGLKSSKSCLRFSGHRLDSLRNDRNQVVKVGAEKPVTWNEAKAVAAKILMDLRAQFNDRDIRLVLRALNRSYQTTKEKTNMQTPTIIVSEQKPGTFQIDVSGRFGGGFRNLTTDRAGVLSRLGMLKSYDCGEEPATVICPESLEPEFRKVFPNSFPTEPINVVVGAAKVMRKIKRQVAQIDKLQSDYQKARGEDTVSVQVEEEKRKPRMVSVQVEKS